jgi:hypothetical protein
MLTSSHQHSCRVLPCIEPFDSLPHSELEHERLETVLEGVYFGFITLAFSVKGKTGKTDHDVEFLKWLFWEQLEQRHTPHVHCRTLCSGCPRRSLPVPSPTIFPHNAS